MKKGEVWWADLAEPVASDPGFRRPVVVTQSDVFNESRISTVICAVLTTNLNLAVAPGNILLPRTASRLPKDSVINVSQIVTLDKAQLTNLVSALPRAYIRRMDTGLRLVFGI